MKIELVANGTKYQGWAEISITKSMQSLANNFSMKIFQGLDVNINAGDPITILKDGKVFLTGFIDSSKLSIKDKKNPLALNGRSKPMDLIDCNIFENKQYNKQNIKQIISDLLKPFNLTVSTTLSLKPLEVFDTKVGETYFNAINRLCKQTNTLPISDNNGNVVIIKNEQIKSSIILKDQDFKELDYNQNFTNRYSKYTYKKEGILTDISDGSVNDEIIERFRPFVGINTDDKTNEDLSKWQKNLNVANSINLTATVIGWDLEINTIVKLETEIINNSFLIKDILYTKDNNGTISKLTLVSKDLYNV